jgi:hypothetical protein
LGHQVEHFVFSFFSTCLSSVHWSKLASKVNELTSAFEFLPIEALLTAVFCLNVFSAALPSARTIVHLVPELSSSETVLKLFWSNPPANVRLLTQGQARLLAGARKRPDPKLS